MARSLASKPNVTAPGGSYPFGRIKDNTGSGNGTPVNEQVYGDFHQFFEKVMATAGLTFNGLPENNADGFQYYNALITVIQSYTTPKANSNNAALTGVPTAPTASLGTNTTQLATTAFVKAAVDALVNAAPGLLDTLKELADAIGDDPNFATTVATSIANEATTRSNADTTLQNNINSEATTRANADAAEITARNNAIADKFKNQAVFLSFDTFFTTGHFAMFRGISAITGEPSSFPGGNYTLIVAGDNSSLNQTLIGIDAAHMYSRHYNGSSWSAWVTLI
jgi:hypothetical protein